MNIGWIFIICALLILILMAMRPLRKNEQIRLMQEGSVPLRLPDTESHLPVVQIQSDDVQRSLLAGDRVNAIRLYREQTGASLSEAKEAIDRLERAQRQGMEQS